VLSALRRPWRTPARCSSPTATCTTWPQSAQQQPPPPPPSMPPLHPWRPLRPAATPALLLQGPPRQLPKAVAGASCQSRCWIRAGLAPPRRCAAKFEMNAQRAERFQQLLEQHPGRPTAVPAQQGDGAAAAYPAVQGQGRQQAAQQPRRAGGLKKAEFLARKRVAKQGDGSSDAAPGQRTDQHAQGGEQGGSRASAAQRWERLAQLQEQQLQRLWGLEAQLGSCASRGSGAAPGKPVAAPPAATWHPVPVQADGTGSQVRPLGAPRCCPCCRRCSLAAAALALSLSALGCLPPTMRPQLCNHPPCLRPAPCLPLCSASGSRRHAAGAMRAAPSAAAPTCLGATAAAARTAGCRTCWRWTASPAAGSALPRRAQGRARGARLPPPPLPLLRRQLWTACLSACRVLLCAKGRLALLSCAPGAEPGPCLHGLLGLLGLLL
jgi:hypothetical protein